jgi:GNAT superfamily N-acetyltransferase
MTDDDPVVTAASSADVDGVIALIGRVFAEYGFLFDPAVEVPDLLRFAAHYAPPHGVFFVVRRGTTVVGSAGVERLDANTAELHRLYLDTEWRGRRLGRALVETALGWCRAQGIPRLVLWSDTRFDLAHRLYVRMGFRRTGERVLPDDANHTREHGFERTV